MVYIGIYLVTAEGKNKTDNKICINGYKETRLPGRVIWNSGVWAPIHLKRQENVGSIPACSTISAMETPSGAKQVVPAVFNTSLFPAGGRGP